MDLETDQELLQIYFDEAEEHIQTLVQCILDMESGTIEKRTLDETYRAAHSLKGSSSIVGYDEVSHIAHLMEDVFDVLRTLDVEVDENLADLLLQSTDSIKEILAARKQRKQIVPDVEPLVLQLQAVLSQITPKEETTEPTETIFEISPELRQVMMEQDSKRLETARDHHEKIYEILIYIPEITFIDDIRIVNDVLQTIGQIIVKARAEGIEANKGDIPLKLQFISQYESEYISQCLDGFQHDIKIVNLSQGKKSNQSPNETYSPFPAPGNDPQETGEKSYHSFEELRQNYINDSIDKLEKSVDLIFTFEQNLSDLEVLDELFRIFHSFKGSGTGYNFTQVSDISHEAESILVQLKTSQISATSEVFDKLFKIIDRLNTAFQEGKNICVPDDTERVNSKGETKSLAEVRQVESSYPDSYSESNEKRQENIDSEVSKAKHYTSEETLRVSVKKVDELVNISSEILVRRDLDRQVQQELDQCIHQIRYLARSFIRTKNEIQFKPQLKELVDVGPLATLLSETGHKLNSVHDRLNRLHDTVSEGATKTDALATELQSKVMNVRMMPISTIFHKFQRLIRELSRSMGKNIQLIVVGEHNELDKKVLEEINDPLVHLVRNSIDHGIESPQERDLLDKPKKGSIRLEAKQVGHHMIIEIEDDGRGIDPERIKESAIKKGVLTREKANELSKQELLELIFTPAFSTSEKITKISGRGVGLDVVKNNIEKLNGFVEVETKVHSGTKFSLRIPITLAVVRVLIIKVQSIIFAVPAGVTERIMKIKYDDIVTIDNQKVLLNQGESIICIKLSKLIGLSSEDDSYSPCTGLILSTVGRKVCLLIDRVERVQDVVLKSMGDLLHNVPHVSGGCIMRDGEIVIILDIHSLARLALSPIQHRYIKKLNKPHRSIESKAVMVVEDSMISRDMISSILIASGYKVIEATDGVDALSKLRREKCDLVVTDIIMPNMSGFELTKAIRSNATFANLPVVIITNKENEQDRIEGLRAGADSYLVKSCFSQKDLLEIIKNLIETN